MEQNNGGDSTATFDDTGGYSQFLSQWYPNGILDILQSYSWLAVDSPYGNHDGIFLEFLTHPEMIH